MSVEKIWLTHGHIDHVGGAADLRDALKVPIEGPHIADKFLLDNVVTSGARFGMTGVRDFAPDRWLEEGDQVSIGELTFDILHCPGHSPGSVVFFNKELRFAHVGDVLFSGSVGRSDIPGGNHATLIKSITDKLLPLGDDVALHLRPRPRLQHRPGADDQSVSHRSDVTIRRICFDAIASRDRYHFAPRHLDRILVARGGAFPSCEWRHITGTKLLPLRVSRYSTLGGTTP